MFRGHSRSRHRLQVCGRTWRRIMWARFRRVAGKAQVLEKLPVARAQPVRRERVRVRRRLVRSRHPAALVHRLAQSVNRRTEAWAPPTPKRTTWKPSAAPVSRLPLATAMDSGRSRRHPTVMLRVESLEQRRAVRSAATAAPTGTGRRRVRRDRAAHTQTATGGDRPRVRSWICGSPSCAVLTAVHALRRLALRAMGDRIARRAAEAM